MWGDYIFMPFLGVLSDTIFIGILYGVYRKLRYGSFFPIDKRLFYTEVWKVSLYISIFFIILGVLISK